MRPSDRVVVIGGGPIGLTTAFRLASFDIPVVLIESEASVPHQLRASTFHPPTLDMFADYGITQGLIARGRITPTWQVRHHESGEKAEFDLSVLAGDTDHPYRLQCEQSVLCDLLLERLQAFPHAEIRFATTAVAVGQDEDRAWAEAESENGERERIEGRYLVGCDGARSLVRDAIGADFEGSVYPEITLLVTTKFPFETAMEGLSGVNYIWKAGGTFSLLHLPDLWRCSFYPQQDQSAEEALEDVSIQRHLDEVVPDAGPIEILERRTYRVHQRIASRYRLGRMIIAGDAAHLNSPKGGMGMNGGIHDAFNLTAKLQQIWQGAGDDLLDLYERQRRPAARDDIIKQADSNRARMNETDAESRRRMLRELQATAADPQACRAFLLRSSMIEGLRKAEAVQ